MDTPTIGKRFTEALIYLKKNMLIKAEKSILDGTEYGSSTLSEIKADRQLPNADILKILETKYRINSEWILRNKGEMILNGPAKPRSPFRDAVDIGAWDEGDPTETHRGKEFVDLGNGHYLLYVPLVNHVASLGYLRGYADPEWLEELPKHAITVDRIPAGIYRTFVARGESMDDNTKRSITTGDKVTGRVVRQDLYRTSPLHLHKFNLFIIVHKEGITIKEITKHDVEKGIITIHSWNPDKNEYPDQDLELNDVLQLLNVIKIERDI